VVMISAANSNKGSFQSLGIIGIIGH